MKYMMHFGLLVGAIALVAGCGSDNAGNNGGEVQCGEGTVKQYHPTTGAPTCVPADQDGKISGQDAGIVATDTTGGGGTDAGGSAGTDGGGTGGTDAGVTTGTDSAETPDTSGPADPWCDCPPVKKNPGGLEHGKKCDKHEDCLYGYCMEGGHLTGYDSGVKYCTKNNACGTGGDATQCETDGKFKAAFEKTKESGNDKFAGLRCGKVVKLCARQCNSDADCATWNPELPDCIKSSTKYISMGVIGVCVKNPFK